MRRLSEEQCVGVQVDWRTGQFTQRDLAHRWGVSPSKINQLVKGVPKDLQPLINKNVELNQELANLPEQDAHMVVSTAESIAHKLTFINDQAIANAMGAMVHPCKDQNDFKTRADTLLKTKEVVAGKAPESAVQVNIEQMSREDLVRIARGG
jgi:hypothetical protein